MNLQANYERFRQRNAEVIAVAVQDAERARLMQEVTGATFPILADVEHRVATDYGVFNLLGDGVAAPAVFVIDAAGRTIWSYIGTNPSDRPSVDDILDRLPAGE